MTNTSSRHILLIDDDSDDYNVLNYIVEEMNVNVKVSSVTDTENIVEKLKADLPDLVLLDLAIPKKSGFECLLEMRNDEELKNIPVIIYTDSVNTLDMATAKHLGAFLYVKKPSSYSEFVTTMKNILSLDLKIPQPIPVQFAGIGVATAESYT